MNIKAKEWTLCVAISFLSLGAISEEADIAFESDLELVPANSLDELLKNVQERRVVESSEHVQRESDFRGRRDDQQNMLKQAENERTRQEQISNRLETQFEENEIRIGDMQEALDKRLGSLRELFGVLQQVAGDTRGALEGSLTSIEYPGRGEFLGELAAKMGTSSQLASINEMEELWYILQQEMTESGKISKFNATVNKLDGQQVDTEVIRVGAFNIVGPDGYINYDLEVSALVELSRQPSAQFSNTADDLYEADTNDLISFAVDPTRGSLLSLEIQRATLSEMVVTHLALFSGKGCYLPLCDGQGQYPGSIIILVGIVGVLLAIERLITLTLVGGKVNKQRANAGSPSDDNPLGRVLKVYDDNQDVDSETLELKLGEAILQETPSLTRNITIIQVISVVAPLMGLLGTVIGMIQTFQAITLFGTGDPKIMASGISTALMTTVLGLCVAIPTVLLHALVAQRRRSVIHILEEQSQGIIASHAEKSGRKITQSAE